MNRRPDTDKQGEVENEDNNDNDDESETISTMMNKNNDTKSAYVIALEGCSDGKCDYQSEDSVTEIETLKPLYLSNDNNKDSNYGGKERDTNNDEEDPLWKLIESAFLEYDDDDSDAGGPKRNWKAVLQWFQNHEAKEAKDKLLEEKDGDGATALHLLACHKETPLDIVEKILDIGGGEIAASKTKNGRLPLHQACIFTDKLQVIEHLIAAYPEGAREKDAFGRLPLHHLADGYPRNSQAIQYLIDVYPNGAKEKDADGNLALHYACRSYCTLEVVQILTHVYPEGAAVKAGNGSLPLHDACRCKDNPQQAILHLIDVHPDAARERDTRGRLALHLACYRSNFQLMEALIDLYPDSVCEADEEGCLPLHLACKSNEPSQQVLLRLIDEFPESMGVKDLDGKTPFEVSKNARNEASKHLQYVLYEKEWHHGFPSGPWSLRDCMDYMPHSVFINAASQNIDSKELIQVLNRMSSHRTTVFYIMRDFYVYIALIISFGKATDQYLLEEDPNIGWAISLVPLALLMLLFELLQLWRLRTYKGMPTYFADVWNWIELIAIALIQTSAGFLIKEVSVETDSDSERTRQLLLFTGFFLFTSLVSFLKKTFFPFSTFVGGVIYIFWELIPFLIMTAITLVAFAYMYFVSYSDNEGFETLLASFFTAFSSVIGGPDGAVGLLDIVFGVATVIVLLNVVIAIVSKAWDKAIEREYAREVFWKYRIAFILEMGINELNVGFNLVADDILEENKDVGSIRLRFWRASLVTDFILGLFSFGYYWPVHIRKHLFAEKIDEEIIEKDGKKDLVSLITLQSAKLEKMEVENKKLYSQVEEHSAKIDDMKAKNNDLANEMKKLQSQNIQILAMMERLLKEG